MDVIVKTVEETDADHGGDAEEESLHVVEFVDLTLAHGVVTESAHTPAKRTLELIETGVELLAGGNNGLPVRGLGSLSADQVLLVVDVVVGGLGVLELLLAAELGGGTLLLHHVGVLMLDNGVVADGGNLRIWEQGA